MDYPEGTFHPDSTDLKALFYEISIESAAQSVGGKVMYSEDADIQGVKGKIWRIDYNKGNSIMKSKAVLMGDRLYTISVATQKARIRNLDMLKYLDSFKYLSKLEK
jgi:ribosomal protein L35AE/L33A